MKVQIEKLGEIVGVHITEDGRVGIQGTKTTLRAGNVEAGSLLLDACRLALEARRIAACKRSAEAPPADGTAHDPNTLPPPISWDICQACDPKRIAGIVLMRYREQLTGRHLLAAERDVEDAISFALLAQLRDLHAVGRLRPQAGA
jgi:hypothetical protein